MTVKILIKRKFKDANPKIVHEVISDFRRLATEDKGYISSESLYGCDDPSLILVESLWQNKEDWDRYKNSSIRMELEKKYSELFEGPPEYEPYHLGLKIDW